MHYVSATAKGGEQRGLGTPPKHSYAIALDIEVSMCSVWILFATYILLSVWFQIHVLERRVLPTAS
jgi:hypothetical protein